MTFYELVCLISLDVDENEIKKFSDKIADFVKQEEGEIKEIKEPLVQKLGYPIKRQVSAYIVSFDFNLEKEKLPLVEEKLKQEPKILRYLLSVKKVSKKPKKAPRKKLFIAPKTITEPVEKEKIKIAEKIKKQGKVELKEIEKKLEEILE